MPRSICDTSARTLEVGFPTVGSFVEAMEGVVATLRVTLISEVVVAILLLSRVVLMSDVVVAMLLLLLELKEL
jgi:hypothetical protein